MAVAVTFDGLSLHTEPNGPFLVRGEINVGSQDVINFFQGLRMEEYDQAAAQERLTRTVTIPLRIKSATIDAALTNQKSVLSRLAGASRYSPKTLTVTPHGASTTSTFKVYGGSFESAYTQGFNVSHNDDAVLTLVCDWPVYGVTENLGTAGSPLISNTVSPANVTLTPTIPGDVPGDVVLFVKNRDAALSGRSLLVGAVSENTTWTALVDSSTWTVDAGGAADTTDATSKNTHKVKRTGTFGANTIYNIAHWTVPTLPTDRRFVTWLRVNDATTTSRGKLQFQLEMECGSLSVNSKWMSVPSEANPAGWVGVEMGSWPYPLGEISPGGTPTTTANLYAMSTDDLSGSTGIGFDYALYMPEDSSVVFETANTLQILAGVAQTVRVDQDQVFTTGGIPAGTVSRGPHIRTRGTSRYVVHLSSGFMANLDATLHWNHLNVDVYAQYTPRFWHLA